MGKTMSKTVARASWYEYPMIGHADEVRRSLATMRAKGAQIRSAEMVSQRADGRVVVMVCQLVTADTPAGSAPRSRVRRLGRWGIAALALAGLAVVGAVGFALAILVAFVVAHLAAIIVGAIILVTVIGLVAGWAGGNGSGGGRTFSGTFRGKMH